MSTIFPLDPEINDVYQGYLYNGTAWEIIGINLNDVPTGPTGLTGATGPKGDDGATGPKGDDGEPGAPGMNGQDGAPGMNGENGAPGLNGENGAPGQNGMDGADALWNYLGEYNGGLIYTAGDIVTYNGELWYRNVYTSAGYTPGGVEGYWDLLASKGDDGEPGLNGGGGAAGLGYKVRAEIDDSVAAATGISSWIFEEDSAYQNGNRVRISAEDGSFQEGTISDISGFNFQLNIESSNGTLLSGGYYPVTIVGSPGLNGEPGIGYSSEGKVPNNLVIGNVSTDGNSSQTFIFPAKLAYQIGNRVRISQVSNLSNYVEGSIETIDVVAAPTGVAPNPIYSYATTVGIRFDAKGGSGTWTANSTLLSIGLSIPKVTPNLTIGEAIVKTTSTALTSSTVTTIGTFPVPSGSCIAVECVVLISSTSNGSYTASKLLITADPEFNAVADITEYAVMKNNDFDLFPIFTATLSGSNVLLRVLTTGTYATAKVISTSILGPHGAA
jgi:hypothetical protein